MPKDEFGDKWACEPCIRGHRAMKCEHWDRLMVQVRKPGRPLTDCPHPKQHNCNCNSRAEKVKVRMTMIRRDQECLCRIVPSQPPGGLQQPPPMAPQLWQAQDLSQPQPSCASGSAPQDAYPYLNQGLGPTGFPQATRSNLLYPAAFDQLPPNTVSPDQFGLQPYPTVAQHSNFPAGTLAPQQDLLTRTTTTHGEGSYMPSEQPKASCCSSDKSSSAKIVGQNANQEMMYAMLNGSPQTTVYRIPAGIATYNNPMKPEHQAEFEQSSPDYIQTVPAYAESGVMGTAALPADTNETMNSIMATTHHCRCGDGCQCIACPVHPGNANTQARVAEMYDLLENEPPFSPTSETIPPWSSSQGNNDAMATSSQQASAFQVPSDERILGQQSEYVSHQASQHWTPAVSSTQAQVSPPGSDPGLVNYPHSMLNASLTNGRGHGSNSATPSQNYLHFQYSPPYMNGH